MSVVDNLAAVLVAYKIAHGYDAIYEQLETCLRQLRGIRLNNDVLRYIFTFLKSHIAPLRLVCKQWNRCATPFVTRLKMPSTPKMLSCNVFPNAKQLTCSRSEKNVHFVLKNLRELANPNMVVDLAECDLQLCTSTIFVVDLNGAALVLPRVPLPRIIFKNVRYVKYNGWVHEILPLVKNSPCNLLHDVSEPNLLCFHNIKWNHIMLAGDTMHAAFWMENIEFGPIVYLGAAATQKYMTDEDFRERFIYVQVKLFHEDVEERKRIFNQ